MPFPIPDAVAGGETCPLPSRPRRVPARRLDSAFRYFPRYPSQLLLLWHSTAQPPAQPSCLPALPGERLPGTRRSPVVRMPEAKWHPELCLLIESRTLVRTLWCTPGALEVHPTEPHCTFVGGGLKTGSESRLSRFFRGNLLHCHCTIAAPLTVTSGPPGSLALHWPPLLFMNRHRWADLRREAGICAENWSGCHALVGALGCTTSTRMGMGDRLPNFACIHLKLG